MSTKTISPDYKERYGSTPTSCECPARSFSRTQAPCKHMLVESRIADLHEIASRKAALAFNAELRRFGTEWDTRHGVYTCGCDVWIDSLEGGIDQGGDCPHVAHMIRQFGEVYDDPFQNF